MKRMVYKKHLGKDRHKLQMAPLVDVVFQLLIFFLVASEVRPTEADFETNLPAGEGARTAKVKKKEVYRVYMRNLDAQGKAVEVSLNNEVIGGDAFRELTRRLTAAAAGAKENMLLVIDGDAKVRLKFITKALDSAVAAGVPQITFGKPRE